MKLDISEFPFVWMDYMPLEDDPVDEVLQQIRGLLDRNEPFVFISRSFPEGDSSNQESKEDRHKVAVWKKENKHDIHQFIKANIQIVSDTNQQASIDAFSELFERFWGYPMFTATTEQKAYLKAFTLLAS
ncbi:hypothetical protein [Vibrio aphrogenes]|uniref:hypothetical protein n=1 Tax=Vibrio aphrogenes TaxID=1891186 RepID=UPI000B351BB1|nr:hypothetical protein [Vibrio aphrogenes]